MMIKSRYFLVLLFIAVLLISCDVLNTTEYPEIQSIEFDWDIGTYCNTVDNSCHYIFNGTNHIWVIGDQSPFSVYGEEREVEVDLDTKVIRFREWKRDSLWSDWFPYDVFKYKDSFLFEALLIKVSYPELEYIMLQFISSSTSLPKNPSINEIQSEYLLNTRSKVAHKISCGIGKKAKHKEYSKNIPKGYSKCGVCFK